MKKYQPWCTGDQVIIRESVKSVPAHEEVPPFHEFKISYQGWGQARVGVEVRVGGSGSRVGLSGTQAEKDKAMPMGGLPSLQGGGARYDMI